MVSISPTKPLGARQADVAHGEEEEYRRIPRHPVHQTAVEGDVAGVHPVVDHPDAEEERAGDHPVADHLEDRPLHSLHDVAGEDAHGDEAHVRHRRIGDELLDVGLPKGDQRGVDDGDQR